jgi:hypothetical protein
LGACVERRPAALQRLKRLVQGFGGMLALQPVAQVKPSSVDALSRYQYLPARDYRMIIERVELENIRTNEYISILSSLDVGECLFFDNFKKAQSLRSLTYYLKKTRNLERNFMFRKMDQGWRLIRTS